jgi:hypothetical protein
MFFLYHANRLGSGSGWGFVWDVLTGWAAGAGAAGGFVWDVFFVYSYSSKNAILFDACIVRCLYSSKNGMTPIRVPLKTGTTLQLKKPVINNYALRMHSLPG